MTQANENPIVFIGTYTHTDSQGIYTCHFDAGSGALEQVSVATGAGNPSFLALHPSKRFLYAASEVHEFDGKIQGAVYAYSVNPDSGALTYVNSQGTGGEGPCHIKVDTTGHFVLAANYHGGSVCMLPIEDDGSLAPPPTSSSTRDRASTRAGRTGRTPIQLTRTSRIVSPTSRTSARTAS